ncbi:MAG: serine/threonine-protein kinase, partial [Amaricoccus sp.]|uniref:serine/threonine-protein kinase n=1 Tax=Amaricoccus sp. TaxID=1872485 RepID=UPI0033163472
MFDVEGGYRVSEPIGKGNQAVAVFKGTDAAGREWAFKMVQGANGETRERLEREASLLQERPHPNVIRSYPPLARGFGEGGKELRDALFLRMDLANGRELGELSAHGALGSNQPASLVVLARQLVAAVAHLHACDVLHRDLKPSNVMVSWAGPGTAVEPDAVKLIDLGLAKSLQGGVDVTATNATPGTPLYMAPELLEDREATKTSDVFALGLVLLELARGAPWVPPEEWPSQSTKVEEARRRLLKLQKERLGGKLPIAGDMPNWLQGVVNRCLVLSPRGRIADAEAVLEAFDTA